MPTPEQIEQLTREGHWPPPTGANESAEIAPDPTIRDEIVKRLKDYSSPSAAEVIDRAMAINQPEVKPKQK